MKSTLSSVYIPLVIETLDFIGKNISKKSIKLQAN